MPLNKIVQFNVQRISFEEDHEVETVDEAKAALQKIIGRCNKAKPDKRSWDLL